MAVSSKERSYMYPSTSPLSTVSDDEKEAKIKREDGDKLRLWIAFFLLLSVAAFFAGGGLQRVKNQKEYSSFDSQPVAVVGNSKQQFSQEQEPAPTLEELQTIVNKLDTEVRNYKNRPGIIMETDPAGLELTKKLQRATEALIRSKYHPSGRFRVRVHLVFPESIPDYSEATSKGSLLLELNDIHVLPCSVYQFLEIASTWKSGSFHRNAGHVLQVQSRSSYEHRNMPFQEYSPEFPHTKGTTGYAGRPSSTGWYVSIQDNTRNHGPGSQQKQNPHEADSNFGRVIEGMMDVVPRIHSVPQKSWLDKKNQIDIPQITVLVPTSDSSWIPLDQYRSSKTE